MIVSSGESFLEEQGIEKGFAEAPDVFASLFFKVFSRLVAEAEFLPYKG